MRSVNRIGIAAVLTLVTSSASADPILSLIPLNPGVALNDPVELALTISGLDAGEPSLGAFDVDVTFDPAAVSFSGVSYGDPILGDQLDLFGLGSFIQTVLAAGRVNLFEVSLDLTDDLNSLQPDAFTLAVLTFVRLTPASTILGVDVQTLSDAMGSELIALTQPVEIQAVPEPGTVGLLALGLACLEYQRRKGKSDAGSQHSYGPSDN